MPAKIPKPTSWKEREQPIAAAFGEKVENTANENVGAKSTITSTAEPKTQNQPPTSKSASKDIQTHLEDYLLAVRKTGCSLSTIRNYKSDINQFLEFTDLKDIKELGNKPKVLAFAHYQRDKGLKENSIRRKLISITQFKIWLKEQNLLTSEIPLQSLGEQVGHNKSEQLERQIINQSHQSKPKLTEALEEKRQTKRKKPRSRLLILLNLLSLFLFLGGLAYFAYQQFGQALISMAYPSIPNAPNRILSYQGRLTNTAQSPISAPTDMTFRLYDADTGGTLLWSSNTCSVDPDQDGIFNTNLGAGVGDGSDGDDCGGAINDSVFTENSNVWLEVQVDAETLTPRQPIRTVAYAINSETLQGLRPAEIATHSTILMMNGSGEVVLGTDNPVIKAASTSSGLTIEANQIMIQTNAGSNGDIVLAPDGTGSVDIQGDLSVSGQTTLVGNTYITSPNTLIFNGTTALGEITSPTDSGAYLIGVYDEFTNSNSTNVQAVLNDLDAAIVAGASLFTDSGTLTYLTSTSDDFAVGASSLTAPFSVDVSDNIIRFGTGATNNALLNFYASDGNTGSLTFTTDDAFVFGGADLGLAASSYLNWGSTIGTTGYGLRDNAGTLQFKNSSGTWADIGSGTGSGDSFWLESAGALSPSNSTLDLLLGDSATASAKFAFLNMASGTPTFSTVGNGIFGGHVAIGANSAIDDGSLLWPTADYRSILSLQEEVTDMAGYDYFEGITNYMLLNPSGAVDASVYGVDTEIRTDPTNATNYTYLYGNYNYVYHQGTGTVSGIYGSANLAYKAAAGGVINNVRGSYNYADGGTNTYGVVGDAYKTNAWQANTAGTIYGGYFNAQNTLAVSTGTDNNYGSYINVLRTGATGGTINTYGQYINMASLDNAGAGTHNAYGLYLSNVTGADNNYSIYSNGGTNYFSGNVGIGTPTPGAKLDIYLGNINVNSGYGITWDNSARSIKNDSGSDAINYSSVNGHIFKTYTASTYNEKVRIDTNGNVGISTTSPDRKLEVLDATNPQLRLTHTDSSIYSDFHMNSNGDLDINVDGNTNQLVLDNGGNVGIGLSNPDEKLTVSGSINAEKYYDYTNKNYFLDPAAVSTALNIAGSAVIGANATASGNVTMGGQLQVGRFEETPTAVGEGAIIFNTSTDTHQCYNGSVWYNCGGTLYSNTNASVADGSYITVTHGLVTNDLLSSAWINAQGTWKSLDANYKPAIAWEGKDTQKGVYHNELNSYSPNSETSVATSTINNGLLFDTFEDLIKTDSANTTASLAMLTGDNGSANFITLRQRLQSGRVGLMGGQTYSTSTTDNDGQTYLGSNTVNDMYYYDRAKDSVPEVLVELGIDPNWYNGVTLSVATSSASYSQNGTLAEKNPNLTTSYNGSLIKATGTDTDPQTIYITIKTPTTFDWTNYNGDSATGVTITPGAAQALGSTGVSATFTGGVSYNVGDVFKIASWYIEPESATRGVKQQFPEKSFAVASGTAGAGYIDVIDADTQKLWMRFSEGTGYYVRATGNRTPKNVHALNGKLYFGQNDGAGNLDGIFERVNFDTDSLNIWTAANKFIYDQGISKRNTASNLITVSSIETIVANYTNDVAAAVIPNQRTQEITVSGWGYIQGDGTSTIQETVNLPYKFNSIPHVVTNTSGGNFSSVAPKSLSDCASGSGGINTGTNLITNNTFQAQIRHNDNSTVLASTWYLCYTWTATGTVSPKQFVAVATGATSADGGTTIINETDGTKVDVFVGSQHASAYRQTKVDLTNSGDMYLITEDATTPRNTLDVYYGVAGLASSEASLAQYRSGLYRVNTPAGWSTNGPTILGPDTVAGITSLKVTEKTSTINSQSNTIFVGSTSGVSVIQENQGMSNFGDGSVESTGSVKYYTKDYISEEMIGDIRGMWPLSANGAISMSDASVKANTLTNNGSVTAVTGVRGAAASFNGSNYLSCTDAACGGTSKLDGNGTATTAWSVGAWFKTATNNSAIIIKNNVNVTYGLFIESNKVDWRIVGGNIYSNKIVTDNVWHHAVGTYDGTNMRLYVDGVLEGTVAYSGGVPDTSGEFTIGAWNTSGTIQRYMNGLIDEPFVTATTLTAGQIKNMYQVGYRALQSHSTGLGSGGADTNQQLTSGTSNAISAAIPDYNNQYMYVGINDATHGRVTKVQLNSDTRIKTYHSTTNAPTGGPNLVANDVSSLAVGETLLAAGSAASGVKSMGFDDYSTASSGNYVSKTFELPKNIGSAVLWVSPVLDSNDGSNTLTIQASNDGGANYATCTLVGTDSNRSVPEREYACTFATADNDLKVRFQFARGSTKTNTYVTEYGISWLGETGFRVEQTDNNNVRLYNFSGETQNLKLNVTGASTAALANPWTDAGSYLYATGYESLRIYDGAGTNYLGISHDGTLANLTYNGTTVLSINSTGDLLPNTNDTQSLGSTAKRWKDLFVGGETIHIGTSLTDEATIAYDTTNNIFQFDTDTTTNGDIAFFTNQLYLDKSSGSIGIGTTAPTFKFEVNSGAAAPSTIDLTNTLAVGTGNANATSKFLGQIGFVSRDVNFSAPKLVAYISAEATENYAADTDTGSLMRFYTGTNDGTNPVERMVITNLGRLGVGISAPLGVLQTKAATDQNLLIRGNQALSDGISIYSVNDTNSAIKSMEFGASLYAFQSGNVGIGTITPGTHKLSVVGTAGLSTGTAWTNTSDVRLKTIEENLDGSSLDKIMQLNPVSFRWNALHNEKFGSSSDKLNYGFIAQEVEGVLPSMITTDADGFKWYNPSGFEAILTAGVQELNLKVSTLAQTVNQAESSINSTGELTLTGSSAATYAVATPTGPANKIAAFADIFVARLNAGLIRTRELFANSVKTNRITTDQQKLAIEADTLITGNIEAQQNLKVAKDLEVTGSTKLGQLAANNASVAGTLRATEIEVSELDADAARFNSIESKLADLENATVSGTLYANNIEAQSISANVITGLQERLSDQIERTLSQPSLLASLLGESTATTEEYLAQLNQELNANLATASSTLDPLGTDNQDLTMIADSAFIKQYFEVNGSAYVATSLKLGQNLMISDHTVFGANFISYQPELTAGEDFTFSIQPAGLGKLSLLAGLMQLDSAGLVTINGDLRVAGALEVGGDLRAKNTLLTNLIGADRPGEDINVQLASLSGDELNVEHSNFAFLDENNNSVASFSASGDLSLSGSLRLQQKLSVASESGELVAQNSRSAGQATLPAGTTEITISSDKVEENSMIYVTPMNSTNNQVLYVKSKLIDSPFTPENEAAFTVAIDYALGQDVIFNWWIVQLN